VCLDDVVVEKAFAKRLRWAGWTYSFAKHRKVYGMHIVVLLWCSADGRFRIPVAFRLWRPKRSCAPHRYQTKLELAAGMLTELVAARLPFQYLVADTRYTAGWFTRLAGRLRLTWVGTLPPKTTVVWHGRRQPAADLAARLRLRWRRRLGLRAAAVTAYAPKYGTIRLVVTRNRHGNCECLATNEVGADLSRVVERKQSRWSVETISVTPSSTPGWAPASASPTPRWSATSPWSCSASRCCNSSARTLRSPSLGPKSAGSSPSLAKASDHPTPQSLPRSPPRHHVSPVNKGLRSRRSWRRGRRRRRGAREAATGRSAPAGVGWRLPRGS
jgi:hypothetical protein